MSEKELSQDIAAVRHLITEEARDIVELTEELIDLEEHARHDRPVPHARLYRIRVDGGYHEIDAPVISGEAILKLAGRDVQLEFEVIQHFRDGREEIITPHVEVNLRTPGVERFTTAARIVQVTVDSRPTEVQAGSYTVTAFKILISVAAGRVLDQVVGGEFRELSDNQTIRIKGGEVFVSHVRQGQSS
jgi:hypothetical protein